MVFLLSSSLVLFFLVLALKANGMAQQGEGEKGGEGGSEGHGWPYMLFFFAYRQVIPPPLSSPLLSSAHLPSPKLRETRTR